MQGKLKPILIIGAILLLMYAVPQFRPANVAHSLQIFATTLQQGLNQSG
jgi:hypothetical protein